jgi:hypothetical protein
MNHLTHTLIVSLALVFSFTNLWGQSIQTPLGPFSCTDEVYYCNSVGSTSNIAINDPGNPSFFYPFSLNAIAYNPLDNFIYGIRKPINHLIRFHADGTYEDLGNLGGVLNLNAVVGGFDNAGIFYIREGSSTNPTVLEIDVASLTANTANSGSFNAKDWAFVPSQGKFYGAQSGALHIYTPGGGSSITPLIGLEPGEGNVYGGAFYSVDGYLYITNNITLNIYRIDVPNATAHKVVNLTSEPEDATSCPGALPPYRVIYAANDTICITSNGSNSVNILENDYTLNTTIVPTTFQVLSPPSFGTINYNPTTGTVHYTPLGTPQSDVMKYKICDGGNPASCDYAYIYFIPGPTISFQSFGPYCQGSTPDLLPTTSAEGYSGTWSPDVINTSTPGTTTYIFSPQNTEECVSPVEQEIEILPTETPTFTPIGPLCFESTPPVLPSLSIQNIAGTWTPSTILTNNAGNFVYTFEPNTTLHPCAVSTTLSIDVLPDITISTQEQVCALDLLSYDLPFQISGGGNTFVSVTSNIGNLSNQSGQYIIEDVPVDLPVTITATDQYGCSKLLTYTPNPCLCPFVPNPIIEQNYIICHNASLPTLSVNEPGNGYAVQWFDMNNTLLSTSQTYTPTDTGFLYVSIIQTINNCTSPALPIHIEELPPYEVMISDYECSPDLNLYSLILHVNGSSNTGIQVTSSQFQVNPQSNNIFAISNMISGAGGTFQISDAANCQFNLNLDPYKCECPPVAAPFVIDYSYCNGQNLDTLRVQNPMAEHSLVWYDENQNIVGNANYFIPDTAGLYSVIYVQDINNCESVRDTFKIIENPLPSANIRDTSYCFDGPIPILSIAIDSSETIEWFQNGVSAGHSITFAPSADGFISYQVYSSLTHCKSVIDTVNIVQMDEIQLQQDSVICSTDKKTYDIDITITGGVAPYQLLSSASNAIVNTNIQEYQVLQINNKESISILITDALGCQKTIQTNAVNCDCPYIAPPLGLVNDTICHNELKGIIRIPNPIANFGIQWYDMSSGGSILSTLTTLESVAGNYYVSYVDPNTGCTSAREPVKIIQTTATQLETFTAVCEDKFPVDLEIKISGGIPNYKIDSPYKANPIDNQNYIISQVLDDTPFLITITDQTGCISKDTVKVETLLVPNAEAGPDVTIDCIDGKVNLTSLTVAQKYLWKGPNGFMSSENSTIVNTNGTYVLQVTAINGCTALDTVVVHPSEVINIMGENNYMLNCINSCIDASVSTFTSGVNFKWEGPEIQNEIGNTIRICKEGNYSVIATKGICVSDPFPISVQIDTIAPSSIADDVFFIDCKTNQVTINIYPANTQVIWKDEQSLVVSESSSFTTSIPGRYTLLAFNTRNGCQIKDTVDIIKSKPSFEPLVQNIKCSGNNNGSILLQNISGHVGSYTISFNGIVLSNPFIPNLSPGKYIIGIKDSLSCEYTQVIDIIEENKVSIFAGQDTTLLLGQSYLIKPEIISSNAITSIKWIPSDFLDCDSCPVATSLPEEDITYLIQVTTSNGCTAEDQITLRLKKSFNIEIPNVIAIQSTNNGSFEIADYPFIKQIKSYAIYDRWGNLMYKANKFTTSQKEYFWDGSFKGESVVSGVYVYVISLELLDNSIRTLKGDLTVLK